MSITQLTLDGGQSGIRTLLGRDGVHEPGPQFDGILSDLPLLDQLASFIRETLEGRSVDVVAAGVSGLGPQDSAERLRDLIGGAASQVFLAHDSTTSHLGALGMRQGAVVAAGTGAVTLAVGPAKVARVDGWGHLLGDLGAGFWIGREALSAVLAAYDGRGPETALMERAEAEFPDLSQLYLAIQADPGRVKRIASWARIVSELSGRDDVSRSISQRAGALLADSALSAIRTVSAEPRISRVGNVFLNPVLEHSFRDRLLDRIPDIDVAEPAGSGLDGATMLPQVPQDSPLGSLISHN